MYHDDSIKPMADIETTIQKVEAEKMYRAADIRRLGLFPWLKESNHHGHSSAILNDKLGSNLLKARITGDGKGREYRIKGKNIIKYLEAKYGNSKQHERSSSG